MAPDDISHDPSDAVRRAWQEQGPLATAPTLDELRRRSQRFASRISWRNAREYVAGALVMPVIIADIVRGGFNGLVDLGNVLLIVGAGSVLYQLHRQAGARPLPSDLGTVDALTFHRSELVRQRDLLMSVWRWYLLPFAPGMVVIFAGRALQSPDPWQLAVRSGAGALAVAVLVAWLNRRAGRRLSRDIDALDQLGRTAHATLAPAEPAPMVELLTHWVLVSVAVASVPLLIGAAVGVIPMRPPGALDAVMPSPAWIRWWMPTATGVGVVAHAVWWWARKRNDRR